MKVILLCGVFAEENEDEIIGNTKKAVEFSANIFQKKLIKGFYDCGADFTVISAPLIGSFPNNYKKIFFKGFKNKQNKYRYVKFNNIWGLRNFSRAKALKKELKPIIRTTKEKTLLVVYSAHTPFLEAAVYAKKKNNLFDICLIVPDLPQYMNLNKKQSILYKIGKKYDLAKFYKLNKFVDSYMLLTKPMKDVLKVGNRPYFVAEGIVDKEELNFDNKKLEEDDLKYIVYTGKLNYKFGVKNLIDAFMLLKNSDLRLVLCGKGDIEDYIKEKQKDDDRIMFMGQLSPEESKKWIKRANVLVNPRQNDEEYTKYSFPSKNIEYLLSGNPVVAYKLDGMPEIYCDFINIVEGNDNQIKSLSDSIKNSLSNAVDRNNFVFYAKQNILSEQIAKKIENLLTNYGE